VAFAHSRGKLNAAVMELASHPGEIHVRLLRAASLFANSDRNVMPTEAAKVHWDRIMESLTGGTMNADEIEQVIPTLSTERAIEIARSIVHLDIGLTVIRIEKV
jgi:hypothetical protein